jgi:uncharacterized RmlC-like cupin family protein
MPRTGTPKFVRAGDEAVWQGDGVTVYDAVSEETAGAPELFFGRFVSTPGTRIPPHFHTCDTAALLVKGRAAFTVGEHAEDRHELRPGDYLYVPAHIVHTEETVGDADAEFVFARDKGGGETVYLDT